MQSGLVEYFYDRFLLDQFLSLFISRPRPQIAIYNKCLKQFGARHTFMAFIDTDEFIVVPPSGSGAVASIPTVLRNYEQYGAVVLNWKVFGSSGHVSRPAGGVLSQYHKCYPEIHIKSVVQTSHTISASDNPHHFVYKEGFFAVNEAGKRADSWFSAPPSFEKLYINHYTVKSEEDFQSKMVRGSATYVHKKRSYFDDTNRKAVDDCPLLSQIFQHNAKGA